MKRKSREPEDTTERKSPGAEAVDREEASQEHFDIDGDDQNNKPVMYVGIGASAGGLEAIEAFFSKMPGNTGTDVKGDHPVGRFTPGCADVKAGEKVSPIEQQHQAAINHHNR